MAWEDEVIFHGVCESCGEHNGHVAYAPDGRTLCQVCYEMTATAVLSGFDDEYGELDFDDGRRF